MIGTRVQTTDAYHPEFRLVGVCTDMGRGYVIVQWDDDHPGVAELAPGWVEPEGSLSTGRPASHR